MNTSLSRSRATIWMMLPILFLLIGSSPVCLSANPPVVRSLDFNGSYSNILYHPVAPWMNTNVVHLTVETWVYARRLEGLQALVARAQSTNLWFGFNSNRLRFARSGGTYVESTDTVPLRRWTHVAATYDGATARFYINGTLAGAAPLAHGGNDCTNSLSFGGQHDIAHLADFFFFGYPFDGQLDEVRLWATARSETQIASSLNKELRSAAWLLATFGDGGDHEDLRDVTASTLGLSASKRQSGFGMLPSRLCIPWHGLPMVLDGEIDLLNEYEHFETIVLRSDNSPTAADQPAYVVGHRHSSSDDLFVGIPGLPVGVEGAVPVVQFRSARDMSKGAGFTAGDWECRATEGGLLAGTMLRTNAHSPGLSWQPWPAGTSSWSAVVVDAADEFFKNYEFRIPATNLNSFSNSVWLMARYYNQDSAGTRLAAPVDANPARPESYMAVDWCGELFAMRIWVSVSGSISNLATRAGAEGLEVSMYSGDSAVSSHLLSTTLTDSNGLFTFTGLAIQDRPVTVAYAPPGGGGISYLEPLTPNDQAYDVVKTNSPYSVTYSSTIFAGTASPVHFRFLTAGALSLGGVSPGMVPALVTVRTDPYKSTPTNQFTLSGSNLHAGIRLYLQGPGCSAIPPVSCLGTPDFIEVTNLVVSEDGLSLTAQTPTDLPGGFEATQTFRLVVEDPQWVARGGNQWNYGPNLTVVPPLWAQVHGFEFPNEDDHPSVEEFEACFGDNIFLYTPIPIRNPYYVAWAVPYFAIMEITHGSCYGFSSTARLLQEGTLMPWQFDTIEGDGVHGVIYANGFRGLNTTNAPKPARWSGFDLFQPFRPLNLWGRITSFAGVQMSAEGIRTILSQLGRPRIFGPGRGLAAGNPTNVLSHVRGAISEYVICIQRRDFGDGHCVVPYAVLDEMGLAEDGLTPISAPGFSLIKIYDNNNPGEERFLEVDRLHNSFRYNPFDFGVEDPERDNYLGAGMFFAPLSIFRGSRHAPSPEELASYGLDFTRILMVGTETASITNATGERAGWTTSGLTNTYPEALPYCPVGYIPGTPNRWDTTMLFLPDSNAPTGGTFTSRGSNVLIYAAQGWTDFAFGFVAPNTTAPSSIYGMLINSNQNLQGLGLRSGAPVQGFGAIVSARDPSGPCRVWTLDAGSEAIMPDVELSHEGLGILSVRNNASLPLTYRVNLAGVNDGSGAFEFSCDWITHPPGVTMALRTLPGQRGFQRELDSDNDGKADSIDELPARGALRVGQDGGSLALRWRQAANNEVLESTEDLANPSWSPVNTQIGSNGLERSAGVSLAGPNRFYRVRPVTTNCSSLAGHDTGPKPNPWETNGFKFEAFTAFGTMRPANEIVTRSGTTGLDVYHTVRIQPQDDYQVLHLDLRQTSGGVVCEAINVLGLVVSRAELTEPGTGLQRVTLRGFRERIHQVRVTSPNALCLIHNICGEREAQPSAPQFPPSCLSFENLTPDFLNSPATFGLAQVSTDQGPLSIEALPDIGVTGLNLSGRTTVQFIGSFGTCKRVTIRLRDPIGGSQLQARDWLGNQVLDSTTTVASPDPQTIVLEGPGIGRITIDSVHGQAHLLEICCERSFNQGPIFIQER